MANGNNWWDSFVNPLKNWWEKDVPQFIASQRAEVGGAFPWEEDTLKQVHDIARNPPMIGMAGTPAGAAKGAATVAARMAAEEAAATAAKTAAPAVGAAAPQAANWLSKAGNWLWQAKPTGVFGMVGKVGVPAGAGYLGYNALTSGQDPSLWPQSEIDAAIAAGNAIQTGPGWTQPAGYTPPAATPPTKNGEKSAYKPPGVPEITTINGVQFWRYFIGVDADGNDMYSDWEVLPGSSGGLTPEQMMSESERDRILAAQRAQWEGANQLQQIELQNRLAREREAAGQTENLMQMYAADPYKYWAQLKQMTPEAVARLTGGAQQAGQPFIPHPFSYPSAQWWGNLLPSEQQQIGGALNWMGIDPQDWYAMYQKMIPGLATRQPSPQWAR